ncbi:hypothetical protein ABIA14_001324 [Sinorhizobium fredii]
MSWTKAAIGMAYVSLLHRPLTALLLSIPLVACSTDVLSPPARIDAASRVGAIRPSRVVANPQQQAAAYPSEEPVSTFSDRTAGAADPQGSLPMIDSQPEMAETQVASAGPMTVPPEGVNMDAMLGVEPVVGLAQEQAGDIAEGNTAQPVVGGIGEDNVRQLGGPAEPEPVSEASPGYDPDLPPLSPEQISAEEVKRARPVEPQRTIRRAEEPQQVAFLPRARNPLSTPEYTGEMPRSEIACRQRLQKLGVTFRDVPRIYNGPSCGIDYPVEISGLSAQYCRQACGEAQLPGDRSLRQMGEIRARAVLALSLLVRRQDDQAARRLFLPDDELAPRQSDVGTRTRQCYRRRQIRVEERQGDRRAPKGLLRLPGARAVEGGARRQLQIFPHRARPRQRPLPQGPFPLRPQDPEVRLPPLRLKRVAFKRIHAARFSFLSLCMSSSQNRCTLLGDMHWRQGAQKKRPAGAGQKRPEDRGGSGVQITRAGLLNAS